MPTEKGPRVVLIRKCSRAQILDFQKYVYKDLGQMCKYKKLKVLVAILKI